MQFNRTTISASINKEQGEVLENARLNYEKKTGKTLTYNRMILLGLKLFVKQYGDNGDNPGENSED